MATVNEPRQLTPIKVVETAKVSLYDRVSSVVLSMLVHFGAIFIILSALIIVKNFTFFKRVVPVDISEEPYGRGDHAPGVGRDMEAPGDEELPELAEGQIAGSLDAVSEIVSSMDVVASDVATAVATTADVPESTSPVRGMPGKGQGGLGDSRPPGPLGDGPRGVIPRWERWEIQYEAANLETYARQLDFFKVEIGAAGGKKEMDYAFNFTKSKPDVRTGPGNQEKRFYVTWRAGTLQQFDRSLLGRAGVPTQGRLVMQFFPTDLENTLARMEAENAKGRKQQEYLKTVFKVRPVRNGYEFFIVEQRFRPAPANA